MKNPYKAPAAALEDPREDSAPMPPEVRQAYRTLWVVFVISFLTLHPDIRGEWWATPDAEDGEAMVLAGLVVAAVFSALYAFFVFSIGRRRSWARWALLVFLAFGTLLAIPDFPRSMSETPVAAAADVLITLAEAWALYHLFLGPGAQWFRRR